jgi:hypothetical protein
MNKAEFDLNLPEEISKRRKTAHGGDKFIIQNPMKVFDLKSDIDDKHIENELDSKSKNLPNFNYLNSHKKRNFNELNEQEKVEKVYVSQIPRFVRNVNIIYSKYSDSPTQIPKFN